jgi:hypothetical protein
MKTAVEINERRTKRENGSHIRRAVRPRLSGRCHSIRRRIVSSIDRRIGNRSATNRTNDVMILPKSWFLPMEVEADGIGAGTRIRFQMRVFGKIQNYRAVITEPEPGRQLDEPYLEPKDVVSRFFVHPWAQDGGCEVRITTEGKTRGDGLTGWMEQALAGACLRRIFRKELELPAALAESTVANPRPEPATNRSSPGNSIQDD